MVKTTLRVGPKSALQRMGLVRRNGPKYSGAIMTWDGDDILRADFGAISLDEDKFV